VAEARISVLQRPSDPSLRQVATGPATATERRLLPLLRALSAPTIGSRLVAESPVANRESVAAQPFDSSQGEDR
jgi:hypothetical protein